MALSDFPTGEADAMRAALDQHARHIGERLEGNTRLDELTHIRDALQQLPSSTWRSAEALCSILIDCIQRREADPAFHDDVARMRAAVSGLSCGNAGDHHSPAPCSAYVLETVSVFTWSR